MKPEEHPQERGDPPFSYRAYHVSSSRTMKDSKDLGPSAVLIASFLVEIEKMSLRWGWGYVSRIRILTVENE